MLLPLLFLNQCFSLKWMVKEPLLKESYERDLTLVWYWTSIAPENVYGTKRRKLNWFGGWVTVVAW